MIWIGAELTGNEPFLALHASVKVVAAYLDFQAPWRAGELGSTAGTQLDRLLMKMRRDLCYSGSLRSDEEDFGVLLGRDGEERRING